MPGWRFDWRCVGSFFLIGVVLILVRIRVMITKRLCFVLSCFLASTFGVISAFAQPYYPPGPPPGYYPGYPQHYRPPPGSYYGPRVERAVYGTRGRYIDVTAQVRRFALNGVRFEVSNATFGFDPYKGREKKLRVTLIRPDGVRVERSWDEGDNVRL